MVLPGSCMKISVAAYPFFIEETTSHKREEALPFGRSKARGWVLSGKELRQRSLQLPEVAGLVAVLRARIFHGRQMLHRFPCRRARFHGGIQTGAGIDFVAHVGHPLTVSDGLLEERRRRLAVFIALG